MARAGVNLRVEDIDQYLETCAQQGIDPLSLPALKIMHDDTEDSFERSVQAFTRVNSQGPWRCMVENSQLPIRPAAQGGLPDDAEIIGWNEGDQRQYYWDSWWKQLRTQKPNAKIHYGAPNVDNQWPRNDALQTELDYADWHIGSTFSPPPATTDGKPSVVTEVDIDFNRYGSLNDPGCIDELLACVDRCLATGQDVYVWGLDPFEPDASKHPLVLQGLVKVNAKYAAVMPPSNSGGTPVGSPTNDTLQQQNGLDAEAEYKSSLADVTLATALHDSKLLSDEPFSSIVADYFEGPESVFGQLNAIDPVRFPVPSRPQ